MARPSAASPWPWSAVTVAWRLPYVMAARRSCSRWALASRCAGMSKAEPRFDILPSVVDGRTADSYFHRTNEILRGEGVNPIVVMEIFCRAQAVVCGVKESCQLLQAASFTGELWAVEEGASVEPMETAMRIVGPYQSFGLYETAILGILASGSGWASAARRCVEAAGDVPVISFGARH